MESIGRTGFIPVGLLLCVFLIGVFSWGCGGSSQGTAPGGVQVPQGEKDSMANMEAFMKNQKGQKGKK